MVDYQDLVAGSGAPGNEDGPFYSAKFNKPQDLFLNEKESLLYVADGANNLIRVIDLKHQNEVKTIAGDGSVGHADGLCLKASFYNPTCLAGLPDGSMVVFDSGNHLLRLVDPAGGTVSTLAGGGGSFEGDADKVWVEDIWNLAYDPQDQQVYFTEPTRGYLERFDLKSKKIQMILKANVLVPQPKALAFVDGKLLVADAKLPSIYSVQIKPVPTSTGVTSVTPALDVSLEKVGQAKNIVAFAGWPGTLYAYQADGVEPVYRVYPNPGAVVFSSIEGLPLTLPAPPDAIDHFRGSANGTHLGFVSGSTMERRFYATNEIGSMVFSFSDYNINDWMLEHGEDAYNVGKIHDFEYPFQKPHRTFRILLVGRCFVYYEANDKPYTVKNWNQSNYFFGVSKKLEAALNTQAALEDWGYHFQVFNGAMHNGSMALEGWPYYMLPDVIKKYDIDLVLILHDDSYNFFDSYFFCPLTKEGIPQHEIDTEFSLESVSQKFKSGPMADLIQLMKKRKVFANEKDVSPGAFQQPYIDLDISYPEIRKKVIDIMQLPLTLLRKRIESHVTESGKKTRLEMWQFPTLMYVPPLRRAFLKDAYEGAKIPVVDLDDDFMVLGMSFAPIRGRPFEACQFTVDGMSLFTTILMHELIERKEIPMKAVVPQN